MSHWFIKSIEEEQEHRKNNPALRDAASESLPRTFLEVARHRLPEQLLIHYFERLLKLVQLMKV